VPGWIRKILLRGMQVDPGQRYPSMAAMLAALSRDPAVRRRRWGAVAAVLVLAAATGAGARRLGADRRALCAGGPGRAASVWGPPQRQAVERAFTAGGNPSAAHAFATTVALVDEYVGRWTQLYTETCEATHVHGDQSAEVLDLRMACLGERLASVRALGEVLAGADARAIDNADAAASGLPMLARCSDVAMLRAVVSPPEDPTIRARVDALREEGARLSVLAAAGQCERASAAGEKLITASAAVGYMPLVAEAEMVLGRLGEICTDATKSAEHLEQASFAAEISHHDQVVIEAAVFASALHADVLHDLPGARRWLRHGEAVLGRFPGHPILEAWMASARAVVLVKAGDTSAAIDENRRNLALLEKVRPPDHYDVAIGFQNLGIALLEDGQVAAAEPPTARSLALMKKLFGNDSARTAALLLNHGEILTVLHRTDEARPEIEQALSIWRRQNADAYFIAYGLLDLGRLELEAGNLGAARTTLIEAGRTLGKAHPQLSAEVDFALGRTIWAVTAERGKAAGLARQARQVLTTASDGARKVAEIDAWLATHDKRN
jgi:tetratricopeptide (TPR) repeat protein